MIAGEGLVGILLAILAITGIDKKIDLSRTIDTGWIGGLVLMAVIVFCVSKYAFEKEGKAK